jgi:glycosyltransferase involved in cell wall biosynthesis
MRILFLNQFFWPDTAATGQLLSDLARHLVDTGETVEVICGSATYGESNSTPCPDVHVYRLPTAAFPNSLPGRFASYLTFLVGAVWCGLRCPAPDVVVTLTTPPLLSLVGLAIQKLRGARHVIWEMDVYPDIAVDLGMLKRGGLSAKVFGWLADLPRRRANSVIALGECMRLRLLTHGLDEDKIHVAEHWADCDALPGGESNIRTRASEDLSIVYSGNFGRAHDVETIAEAMAELDRADVGLRFLFGGGGSRQEWIRGFCTQHHVKSAFFLPYCRRDELKTRLEAGDIGLVTQQAASAGAIVPSKAYGIMAAGLPLLFIGPRNSTTALMIKQYQCGWQIDCGDVRALVELLRYLRDHREVVQATGRRAYQAFVNHYQRSLGVARFAAVIQGCKAETTAPAVQITVQSMKVVHSKPIQPPLRANAEREG